MASLKKDAAWASWHMAGDRGRKNPISAFPNLFSPPSPPCPCLPLDASSDLWTQASSSYKNAFAWLCWRICNHSQTFTVKFKQRLWEKKIFWECKNLSWVISYQFAHLTQESVLMWLFTHSPADNRGHHREWGMGGVDAFLKFYTASPTSVLNTSSWIKAHAAYLRYSTPVQAMPSKVYTTYIDAPLDRGYIWPHLLHWQLSTEILAYQKNFWVVQCNWIQCHIARQWTTLHWPMTIQ